MQIVNLKYENFQKFCLEVLPENEFVKVLQSTPMELFLKTMKVKQGQMKNEDEIMTAIFAEAHLNQNDFSEPQLAKFRRYVTYFHQVVQFLD